MRRKIRLISSRNPKYFRTYLEENRIYAQLMEIVEHINCGISVTYLEHDRYVFLYANDELYQMFGFQKGELDEILSEEIYGMILPEDLPEVRRTLLDAAISREPTRVECRVKKRDGSIIWIRCRNSACSMKVADYPAVLTFYDDITMEKENERRITTLNNKLGNSEIYYKLNIREQLIEEYHSIYDPDIVFMKSGSKQFSYEELLMSSIYEKDRNEIYKALSYQGLMEHYNDGNTKYSVEYRRYIPTDEVHWFAATAVLTEGVVNGEINAFIYSHDIDQRMKKRIARNRILDQDVDDITIINVKSHAAQIVMLHHGSIVTVDQTDYDENVKHYIESEIATEDQPICREFYRMEHLIEALKMEGEANLSFWQLSAGGSNRRKNVHVTYLDSTHEDLLMVGRDITALFEHEIEQKMALKQAVDLANYANQAKSNFLSRMSHDMRTPLNAIIGLSDLAQKENEVPEIQGYLTNISHSGQYLLSLINDTLDLSKIESGIMEFHRERFPLEEFIQGIDTVIKPLMDAKKIEFVMNLQRQASNIVVDKLRFMQVFYNLLSNAAKYTPEGGRVEFYSEEIPGREGKFGMRFHICDNGIGMSREYVKILFDPYTQEDRPAAKEQKGTGLGLAIVKKIIDLTGGSIQVFSEVNKGTEFIVDLYAHNMENVPQEKTQPRYDQERLRGVHVLLVDDSEINEMIVTKQLELRGCVVHTAENGQDAVNQFKASEEGYYDIILTDVHMPVMDGLEEARQIRALDRTDAKSIPIIAATADAYNDFMEKLLDAGINMRLVKPIEPEDLFNAIFRLLNLS